jgi:uncharacterized protein
MPRVVALYRYPVKGFTPEASASLTALPEGRIAGDRVLGFAFANRSAPDEAWTRKYEFVVLANTPGLARLTLRYDHRAQRLRIDAPGALVAEAALDAAGRTRIAAAVQEYVLGLDVNPLAGHPERMPLRLIGDGVTPRHQDNEAGQITLHGRETLAAVAAAAADPGLSELRFRSNLAIEGIGPWDEHAWIGRRLTIGSVEFDVTKPKVRCLATHANPATGERDLSMMALLKSAFAQEQPTFAVALMTRGAGGEISLGDEVRLSR